MTMCFDMTHLDIRPDVIAAMTNMMHPSYVPIGVSGIIRVITEIDPSAVWFHLRDADDDTDRFNVDEMHSYATRWDGTYVSAGSCYALLSHIPQKAIDDIARKMNDNIIITEVDD